MTERGRRLETLDVVAWHVELAAKFPTAMTFTNEVTHFYGYDGHGNVRFLTDAADGGTGTGGYITDRWDYDAFGNIIARSGSTFNNLLYCGEYRDPDLGLYFLRARYMDTERGRFWTMDVFEGVRRDPRSLHKYLYAHADPVNSIDPSGQFRLIETQTALAIGAVLWQTFVYAHILKNATLTFIYGYQFYRCVEQVRQFNIANGTNADASPCYPLFGASIASGAKTLLWGVFRMVLLRAGFDPFTGKPLGW